MIAARYTQPSHVQMAVVVRPETLQPYSMQVVKSLEQRGSDQNQSYATKQEAGWSSTFAWPE